ncbi:MAG TPA: asparagine synthase C-terminal domain-containing protein, partial [Planctomycetota bacterium]|nr:asparagine synthase C-terminal domain-containing protein [Planctomycetota bacterium]
RYLGERYAARYQRLPGWIRRGIMAPIARRLPADRHSKLLNLSRLARGFLLSAELPFAERYKSYVGVFSDSMRDELLLRPQGEREDPVLRAFSSATSKDVLHTLLHVDRLTQLPDDLLLLTDKMTMATSLECRVPLLDQDLVELAMRMPEDEKIRGRTLKYVLKECLKDVLPKEILHRKKRGFGAPMGAWIKRELAPLMKSVLSRESVEARGLFRYEAIARTIAEHEANHADHTDHLLALMNLEVWCRMTLDGVTESHMIEHMEALVG